MDLMINSVHDLIHILNTRPEWRRQVKRALFPEIDLEKALKELAEAQRRTEEGLQRLEEAQARNEELIRMLIEAQLRSEQRLDKVELILGNHTKRLARLENKVTDAAVDRQVIKERLDKIELNQGELKRNQNDLRGRGYESDFSNKADAIFGRYLRRGRKVRNEVGDHLDEAEENGHVSPQESDQVFAADLLWGGKVKSTKEQAILVVEASWLAEKHDVERAIKRAGILRRIGLKALPVVAGINWVDGLKKEALSAGVVIVTDKQLDKSSWQAALVAIS